jgi:hypothetical protein
VRDLAAQYANHERRIRNKNCRPSAHRGPVERGCGQGSSVLPSLHAAMLAGMLLFLSGQSNAEVLARKTWRLGEIKRGAMPGG